MLREIVDVASARQVIFNVKARSACAMSRCDVDVDAPASDSYLRHVARRSQNRSNGV